MTISQVWTNNFMYDNLTCVERFIMYDNLTSMEKYFMCDNFTSVES